MIKKVIKFFLILLLISREMRSLLTIFFIMFKFSHFLLLFYLKTKFIIVFYNLIKYIICF